MYLALTKKAPLTENIKVGSVQRGGLHDDTSLGYLSQLWDQDVSINLITAFMMRGRCG